MTDLWINKYKPKNLNEIIGNKNQINKIKNWLHDIKYNDSDKMTLIISGNHGIGKTLIIQYILDEYNYDNKMIYPYDIKNYRNTEDFNSFYNYDNSIINRLSKKNKKIALIFTEMENITLKSDKKFVIGINKKNTKKKKFPLIFIYNNKHSKLIDDIAKNKNCTKVDLLSPSTKEITEFIKNIFQKENIKIENDDICDDIIKYCYYDIRKIIIVLQDLHYHFNNQIITKELLNEYKNKSKSKNHEIELFDTTVKIINNYDSFNNIFKYYENDKVLLPIMIHETYIKKLSKMEKNIFNMFSKIINSISYGDLVETSIYTDQKWFLQKIHCFFSCVYVTYYISKNNEYHIQHKDIKIASDLNKTSTKNINKKNISNLLSLLNLSSNKSIDDIIFINNISNKLIKENRIEDLINILRTYNPDITYKQLNLCLKIDKTNDFHKFDAKEKKELKKLYNIK